MVKKGVLGGWRKWALVAGLVIGALVAIAWQPIMLGIAAARSERPPEVLRDFSLHDELQIDQFAQEFPAGASEAELIGWLEMHKFNFDTAAKNAKREYPGIPCLYGYEIEWVSDNGKLTKPATATLVDSACM